MSDQDLNDFNTGLKGVIDEYTQHCGAMNVRVLPRAAAQGLGRC